MEQVKRARSTGVIFNLYPDSLGHNLRGLVSVLQKKEFENAFSTIYLLPTFFHSDLDRGFSIIDYDLNEELIEQKDLDQLNQVGINLKLDIVLNHLSVNSPQFKDLLEKGEKSNFKDFFINWNTFWEDHGEMGTDGIVIPQKEYLDKLFLRKPGLPILKVPFPDGSFQPYWNTFYQEIKKDQSDSSNGSDVLLGQMDVNARSEKVWKFYAKTLRKLKAYGCEIVRLDAFAYLNKEVGARNFFNTPGTWDYLRRIQSMADESGLSILPEIHAEYGAGLHDQVSKAGYMIYDFFLPGLVLHAIEFGSGKALLRWAREIVSKGYDTINMLGCHDGIPVLDLKGKEIKGVFRHGLLQDDEIDDLINIIVDRGGKIKNLYDPSGKKISYYQVNATYYSALGENPSKLLLARAIQLFMPGTPQIWYLDLFAGLNDYAAVERHGEGGHKEINRTNLSFEDIDSRLSLSVVRMQLEMIQFRNRAIAFSGEMILVESDSNEFQIIWDSSQDRASLKLNLKTLKFTMEGQLDGKRFFLEN